MGFLLQLAQSPSDWQGIAERFGVSFLILCALGLCIWKMLWPFLTEQINASRQQVEKTNTLLEAQLNASHSAREKALSEFMNALERRDTEFGKVVEQLENLASLIEGMKENSERNRR